MLAFCAISGPRRRSRAVCPTGWHGLACQSPSESCDSRSTSELRSGYSCTNAGERGQAELGPNLFQATHPKRTSVHSLLDCAKRMLDRSRAGDREPPAISRRCVIACHSSPAGVGSDHQIDALVGDRHDSGIGIRADDHWHDGRVHDTQALDALHTKVRRDNGHSGARYVSIGRVNF